MTKSLQLGILLQCKGLLGQFSCLFSLTWGFCFWAQLMHYASGLLATDSPSASIYLKISGANESRHIWLSRHTQKFTNQKVYFLGLSPEKSAGRNWNNLLAYKFSLTVSPRLFISVIENVSNVAKLTKSNSFDQKMNLARLSVCGSQGKGGKQTKRFNKWSIGERERENLQPGKSEACKIFTHKHWHELLEK